MEISATGKNVTEVDSGIGAVFSALADPTRRRIVDALQSDETTVGELASRLGVATPAMSKHLTVLENAGLISRRRDAQRRLCRLEPSGFQDLHEWARRYESIWAGSLDNLNDYLAGLGSADPAAAGPAPRPGRATRRAASAEEEHA
ncbi:winged helix-turn-helix transcriptional regulator [Planctomonas sp. JC2975]|uniref:ArsR/SmtB family transcription factor n=1 Tax=Planctomonas sp. JC2975 TaxID=2729626 RepID=UPI0014747D30|nr:metalloregulator ArsR/SmtB family transcription factor [Planctomonas sp. JC2975]NNC11972.1 winged helix-turn-helix transcriptional regulator [Planctomonas sp. JC2975]